MKRMVKKMDTVMSYTLVMDDTEVVIELDREENGSKILSEYVEELKKASKK